MERLIFIVGFVAIMAGLIVFTDVPIGGEPRSYLAPVIVEGRVERVYDGDTLRLAGQERSIRIWGIDAPERDQEGGKASGEHLKSLSLGQFLRCEVKDYDRYDRLVALCLLADGTDLAREQIASGHASEWVRYSKGYYSNAPST